MVLVLRKTSTLGNLNLEGGAVIDDIKIQDNVISSLSDSSDILYLDPYPDGLSNEGLLLLKVVFKLMVQQHQLTQLPPL